MEGAGFRLLALRSPWPPFKLSSAASSPERCQNRRRRIMALIEPVRLGASGSLRQRPGDWGGAAWQVLHVTRAAISRLAEEDVCWLVARPHRLGR